VLPASVTTLDCTASRCRSSAAQLRCHGKVRARKGTQKRFRCPHCGRTRSANSGTVYHRLQHSKAKFDQAVTLSVEGVSQAAIARVVGVSVSTVRRWLQKAAEAATTFSDLHIRNLSPVELQADELKTFAGSRKNTKWVHTSMSVWSRLWATLHVGQRRLRDVEVHYRDLRSRVSMFHEPPLFVTDAFKYNEQVVKKVFGNRLVYAQVQKRIRDNRVVRIDHELIVGPEWRLERAFEKSEDSKRINTAFVERLNLTLRRSIAALQRKTTAQARTTESLKERLEVLRCYYNFIRPHGSLRFGRKTRTPAQQAGIATRRLTWRDVFFVPLDRPRQLRVEWLVGRGGEPGRDGRWAFYA